MTQCRLQQLAEELKNNYLMILMYFVKDNRNDEMFQNMVEPHDPKEEKVDFVDFGTREDCH